MSLPSVLFRILLASCTWVFVTLCKFGKFSTVISWNTEFRFLPLFSFWVTDYLSVVLLKELGLEEFPHFLIFCSSYFLYLYHFKISVFELANSFFHILTLLLFLSNAFFMSFVGFFSSSVCLVLFLEFIFLVKYFFCSLILFLSSLNHLSDFSCSSLS